MTYKDTITLPNEKIGNVTLDYSKYCGEDFYSDGAVEDEMLDLVQHHSLSELPGIIEERKSWPLLYHLSHLRENTVSWVPMSQSAKVLEIGSGCGAITGILSKKAGEVTCVDLSRKRSLINAYRNQSAKNITIKVGNFKDIEDTLDNDYDFIFLIGVFEYAKGYIGGSKPYADFLSLLKEHISPEGRIIIAIENKYGLKYFAGCAEDHAGTYFAGIENYPQGGVARTFGRNGLEQIFYQCGITKARFYYPYPDYKFMTTLYSDVYLPGTGELSNNMRNFDGDRMVLFNEGLAFDGILEEGLFPVFSNSYLAVIGDDFPVKYVKYSNDRAEEYRIRTEIVLDMVEGRGVYKFPSSKKSQPHVRAMAAAYESLRDRYRGGELEINRCSLTEREGEICAVFAFEEGVPLSTLMDQCLSNDDIDGFYRLFREYVKRVGYREEYPVADYDAIFSNILVKGNRWILIDYEWTFAKAIPIRELAFRAVYAYSLADETRNKLDMSRLLKELSLTEEEAEAYKTKELEFQNFVNGSRLSMWEMRNHFGKQLIEPVKWLNHYGDPARARLFQVFEDRGEGFSEENSYFVMDAFKKDDNVEIDLTVPSDIKMLRLDPCMDACILRVEAFNWNGKPLSFKNKRLFILNCAVGSNGILVFPTKDPMIIIRMDRLRNKKENHLYVKMEVVIMNEGIPQELAYMLGEKNDKKGGK
jgi:precorrin-6B methylase 2